MTETGPAYVVAIVTAISAVIGLALKLTKVLNELSRAAESKRRYELVKLKYEIEAIRHRNQLTFPKIEVRNDEVAQARLSELSWFHPDRVESSIWFAIARRYHKSLVWLLIVGMAVLGLFLGTGAAIVAVAITDEATPRDAILLLLIMLIQVTSAAVVLTSAARLFVAQKIAEHPAAHMRKARSGA